MRKFLLTAGTLALMATPVLAADPIVDVDAAAYDWTGFYVGLNVGYGFGGDDVVGLESNLTPPIRDVGSLDIEGIFGGVQAGWNFQVDSFVFGIEGDLQIADIDDSFGPVTKPIGVDTDASSDVDFFGTARLRAGWALDRVLIYGTGGLAWANVDYNVFTVNTAGLNVTESSDDIEFGYAVGGGAEFAISDAWTVKAEYLFIGLGHEDLTGAVVTAGGVPTGETITTVMTPSFHTVKIGFNWQF